MENEEARVQQLMEDEGQPEAVARRIARLEAERDAAVGERGAAVGERDAAVGERDAAVGEKKAAMKLAEQAVLAAIKALGTAVWSVQRREKLGTLLAIHVGLAEAHASCPNPPAQVDRADDGRGDHPGRAGSEAMVHRGQRHRHARAVGRPARARADVDRLGQDGRVAEAPGWRALMADPDASSLCRQILRLHMLLGFAGQTAVV